ncbi:MAG: hypothetical protein V9F82_07375 [Dermatophilaceae bacterium]
MVGVTFAGTLHVTPPIVAHRRLEISEIPGEDRPRHREPPGRRKHRKKSFTAIQFLSSIVAAFGDCATVTGGRQVTPSSSERLTTTAV